MAILIDHEFAVAPAVLWDILGTPDRVDWVPGVTSCSFDGEVRSLDLPGAVVFNDRILREVYEQRFTEFACSERVGVQDSRMLRMVICVAVLASRLCWNTTVGQFSSERFIKGSIDGDKYRL